MRYALPSTLCLFLLLGGSANGRANEIVTVDTSRISGESAQIAFDFIGGPDDNTITISSFSTNGTFGAVHATGGVSGNLPGVLTLTDASPTDFFNEYLTNFRLGTTFSFVLSATAVGPASGSFSDAFSLFILDPTTGLSLATTTDPTNSDSLLTLDITGSPQGNLNVYDSNTIQVTATPFSTTTVPEPSTAFLLAGSLASLWIAGRKLRDRRTSN